MPFPLHHVWLCQVGAWKTFCPLPHGWYSKRGLWGFGDSCRSKAVSTHWHVVLLTLGNKSRWLQQIPLAILSVTMRWFNQFLWRIKSYLATTPHCMLRRQLWQASLGIRQKATQLLRNLAFQYPHLKCPGLYRHFVSSASKKFYLVSRVDHLMM